MKQTLNMRRQLAIILDIAIQPDEPRKTCRRATACPPLRGVMRGDGGEQFPEHRIIMGASNLIMGASNLIMGASNLIMGASNLCGAPKSLNNIASTFFTIFTIVNLLLL